MLAFYVAWNCLKRLFGGLVGGVESEFSDRLWLKLSLGQAEQYEINWKLALKKASGLSIKFDNDRFAHLSNLNFLT